MELYLKNKILEALYNDYNQAIINSDVFYFLKAQDALNYFLALEVKEETIEFLITNKKNYNELKQLFEDSEELNEFGKSIFTLISYCDLNAYKKNEFNSYSDKRVLADASVRMNNWVEQLITYKFENQFSEGSVKNAIDYLLHPSDNFTMLSENHRNQISENLFKKKYSKSTFKEDFITFFYGLTLNVKNSLNYTHLLTRISYDISSEWKESIIGIMSPDGTGWQEGAIQDMSKANYIALWNHRKPNNPSKTFKLLRSCIEENGIFKVFYTSEHKAIYVAEIIDFVTSKEEFVKAKWIETYKNIAEIKNNFDDYADGNKSASWVYLANKFYKINPIPSSNFKYYLKSGYPRVGSQTPIISYQSNEELQKSKKMEEKLNLLKYKKQIILQGPPGTGKTREAKLIAKEFLGTDNLKDNEQFKLIQFHPSYTYEDFVRGIVAKPNPDGEGILYEAENKTLGDFATKALDNYNVSKGLVKINSDFESKLNVLIEKVNNEINAGKTYLFGDKSTAEIISVGNDYFLYNFPQRETIRYKILFSDLKKVYSRKDEIKIPIDLRDRESDLQLVMKGKYPYYYMLLRQLENIAKPKHTITDTTLKNYILIIDEINRANLSSVLGELIYALEYRGEEVESMYEVDGSQKLILPPNLFIMGTMNTADRSVGHIDYAIRRRFAFVEVLPEKLNDEKIIFHEDWFKKVSELFITNYDEYFADEERKVILKPSKTLSSEFRPEDVWIGHSYFIQKKLEDNKLEPEEFRMKIDYEIKPILMEYVKDGILVGNVGEQKIEDYIKNL